MDWIEEAKALIRDLGERMSPSAYDIAWVARLQHQNNGHARWPSLLEWLLANQKPDGSWGGAIPYYHDQIICTLSAAIALQQSGNGPIVHQAIKRAEQYLWQHLHLLARDPFELVGFELIIPTLLVEARLLGLEVPSHACGYERIQTAKLRLIPPQMLYSPKISTVHSLEFLGRSGNQEKLQKALAQNGSLGNSPATTSYYLQLQKNDPHALDYLEAVQSHQEHIIYLYPFRTFELTWALKHLTFCGLPITDFANEQIWQELEHKMGPTGIGLDPTFGIPDGDITSLCTQLLMNAGYQVDPTILNLFEDPEKRIFRTYDYERNVSVGTNVHALETLALMPDYPDSRQVREQIVIMLLNSRVLNMYWIDKWHASPYYGTLHALIGLIYEGSYLVNACRDTVEWLIHNQRDDGSWGFFEQSTAEETAYALIALLHYHRYEKINPDVLHRGSEYLKSTYAGANSTYPELWIGKCLYAPYDVVRAAILAALILYEETMDALSR